jgi:hypothetical protein
LLAEQSQCFWAVRGLANRAGAARLHAGTHTCATPLTPSTSTTCTHGCAMPSAAGVAAT